MAGLETPRGLSARGLPAPYTRLGLRRLAVGVVHSVRVTRLLPVWSGRHCPSRMGGLRRRPRRTYVRKECVSALDEYPGECRIEPGLRVPPGSSLTLHHLQKETQTGDSHCRGRGGLQTDLGADLRGRDGSGTTDGRPGRVSSQGRDHVRPGRQSTFVTDF